MRRGRSILAALAVNWAFPLLRASIAMILGVVVLVSSALVSGELIFCSARAR